jgi:hypothetical protein
MRSRVVGLLTLAVVALAGVATVPALARPASVDPSSARPVPINLVGLLMDECVDDLVFPPHVSLAIEPESDSVRFVLERSSASEVDPTSFPIVDFTPEEEAFREELLACTDAHPVSLDEDLPGERVDEAAYQEYRQRRLLPCLANHGVVAIDSELGLEASRYDWYVGSLYELGDLEQAVDVWYECPPLPPYLDVD